MNTYQGDPKIILTEDGATLKYVGGQPIMDNGLENLALISLFTQEGWAGNDLEDDTDKKIGSGFEKSTQQPITLQALNDIRQAGENALKNPVFGKVTVTVENPNSYRLNIIFRIEPPGQDVKMLLVTKNGLNWTAQALDPAYRRI